VVACEHLDLVVVVAEVALDVPQQMLGDGAVVGLGLGDEIAVHLRERRDGEQPERYERHTHGEQDRAGAQLE
jgi:hypothetical protein